MNSRSKFRKILSMIFCTICSSFLCHRWLWMMVKMVISMEMRNSPKSSNLTDINNHPNPLLTIHFQSNNHITKISIKITATISSTQVRKMPIFIHQGQSILWKMETILNWDLKEEKGTCLRMRKWYRVSKLTLLLVTITLTKITVILSKV